MQNIEITMNAVQTFNERINMLKSEKAEYEKNVIGIKSSIAAKRTSIVAAKIVYVILIIVSIILGLLGFVAGCIIFGLVSICISAGLIYVYITYNKKTKKITEELEHRYLVLQKKINALDKEIREYEAKKKDIVLENERRISDNMEETIEADFSFDDAADMKECPQCAEIVKAKAKKCRFCGYDFE